MLWTFPSLLRDCPVHVWVFALDARSLLLADGGNTRGARSVAPSSRHGYHHVGVGADIDLGVEGVSEDPGGPLDKI